jgi:hypothetical protein
MITPQPFDLLGAVSPAASKRRAALVLPPRSRAGLSQGVDLSSTPLHSSSRGGVESRHAQNSGDAEGKRTSGPVALGASCRSKLSLAGVAPGPRETYPYRTSRHMRATSLDRRAASSNSGTLVMRPMAVRACPSSLTASRSHIPATSAADSTLASMSTPSSAVKRSCSTRATTARFGSFVGFVSMFRVWPRRVVGASKNVVRG